MKLDLDEPYYIIANAREDVRKEFWKRAIDIVNGIREEFWLRDIMAMGKEKWMEGRMMGLDAFMNEEELKERRKGLEALYIKIEKESNERTT